MMQTGMGFFAGEIWRGVGTLVEKIGHCSWDWP